MAFPYYQTYQPQYPQYFPNNYQPMQQSQQTYNPVANQSGIIWVSGDQEASLYPIAPNNAVALWARDGKTIYLKSADATGKPSMKVYDLVERAETASDASTDADGKQTAYATKDELKAVVDAVRGIDSFVSSIKTDVDKMSGDLYGIAGKKKTAKRKEADDDADE